MKERIGEQVRMGACFPFDIYSLVHTMRKVPHFRRKKQMTRSNLKRNQQFQ